MRLKDKQKVVQSWIEKNGCASFDLKDRQIIFHDGGGFSVEKKVKYLPKIKLKKITEGKWKGGSEVVDIKGTRERCEFYDCYYAFEDLDETINRLRRMKKMLNDIGYKTSYKESASGDWAKPSTLLRKEVKKQ